MAISAKSKILASDINTALSGKQDALGYTPVKSVNGITVDATGNVDAVSLMMPDYSAGVSLSNNTNFTAPSHGIVITNGRYDDTNSYVYVNDVEVIKTYGSSSGNAGDTFTVPVSKGDIIKVYYYRSWTKGTFFPLKGRNQ